MIRQLLLSETEPGAEAPRLSSPGTLARLSSEFPTVAVHLRAPEERGARERLEVRLEVRLEAAEWRAPGFDPAHWDERVFGAAAQALPNEGLSLHVADAPRQALAATAMEMLTRYQGLLGRRNAASEGTHFDALLARHRALHDLGSPPALAHYRHTLDTWQWVLRLAPQADLALQTAALFHDVERLGGEPDPRLEHLAEGCPALDYQALQDTHAERGAALAHAVLGELGVEPALRERVRWLIHHHERAAVDPSLALLNDADALSFFSLQASALARALPRARARRTVMHTLARLRSQHRWRLARIRLAPPVRRLLEEAMGTAPLSAPRGAPV